MDFSLAQVSRQPPPSLPGRGAEAAPRPVAGLAPDRLLNGQQPHVQLASTPPCIVMSQSQAAVAGVPGAPMELSCQVLIDGESKTVSFPMDFATDTPESVAREMVEELGIPENEATIRDIGLLVMVVAMIVTIVTMIVVMIRVAHIIQDVANS